MPCCTAVNCKNRQEDGFKMYISPSSKADSNQQAQWEINMRRNNWAPTKYSCLCEVHFENSQFENHWAVGWRKLKQTAIPTLFNVPNLPPMITPPPWKSL